jgi:hypothetical protein
MPKRRAVSRVPQLMQDDAGEDHQDEEDPEEGPRHVMALHPSGDEDEPHQQQESGVHVDIDSDKSTDFP